ncbi:MAG: S8 family peptidase [Elusimicrobia bacterium]|nr:S8 family peptidase [Elusimicrobiota bacterium]
MGLDAEEDLGELGVLIAEGSPGKVRPSAAAALRSEPSVLWVEEDYYLPNWLVDMPTLGQTHFPSLLQLQAALPKLTLPSQTEGELPWGIRRVNAPAAWSATQGAGVRVAVIDTGIDSKHPDIAPNYAGGYNALEKDKAPMDDNGHGTHVAGTIAAAKDEKGVVGVAPKARLYAVKVLDADGGGTLTGIIKGIVWCARNNIQVANMSLGAPTGSFFMHLAVKYAKMKGVTIVAAAGNSGKSVSYPGGYEEVIGVAASDAGNRIAPWSSRGPEVDLIAPGVDVLSDEPGGGLAVHSGTSMATPHVAGLAALAVTQGAGSPQAVRAVLLGAAERLPGLSGEQQGAGLVNAQKLLKRR